MRISDWSSTCALPIFLTEVLHQKGMPRFTEKTIVDPAALRCELARIRERGWAVDDEEHTVGMRCVAATIHNEHGEVIAGVSVSGPSVRVTEKIGRAHV